jgi:HPr Serine kinase C-terminal domain
MDISVAAGCTKPRRRPHFRGLHHIVVASFGESDVFVFDLLRRTVRGVISETTAQDALFWNATMLPIAVGVLGATVGVLPVHCACLSNQGEGLLIAGTSGAGKSTLSVALAQHGFDFVSDDWTYLSHQDGRLLAHGMSTPVKLLPDAVRHFPLLEGQTLRHTLNGELAYEVSAELDVGARVISRCKPRRVIFLVRSDEPTSELISIPTTQTRAYLEASVEQLPPQLASVARQRATLMRRLAELPCWTYRYGGTPQFAARELKRLFPATASETA